MRSVVDVTGPSVARFLPAAEHGSHPKGTIDFDDCALR